MRALLPATACKDRLKAGHKASLATTGQDLLAVIERNRLTLLQSRQVLGLYTETYGSSLPCGSFDEAVAFQRLDHLVN